MKKAHCIFKKQQIKLVSFCVKQLIIVLRILTSVIIYSLIFEKYLIHFKQNHMTKKIDITL
jgi:hypothetical protein